MTLAITLQSKNALSITEQDKTGGLTWDEATMTWDEATFPWNRVGILLTQESKNNLTLTNETKS